MRDYRYDNAVKLLEEAKNVEKIKDLLLYEYDVNFFIQQLLGKYFKTRQEYEKFLGIITSKSFLDSYKSSFERGYEDYKKIENTRNYYIVPLENLEITLARYEIILRKVASNHSPEYKCSVEELRRYVFARFDMEKIIAEERLRHEMRDY